MNRLAVCAIAKDEDYAIEEWVCFHRAVGVEHFYIYDNGSTVPLRQTLAKYVAAGHVTCIDFPGAARQMPAYDHCLECFGAANQWIAFIDCDEFLHPKETDSVPEVLLDFDDFGGLQVNWVLFGSHGLTKRPAGLVMESYTQGSGADCESNLHTKAIVQPRYTRRSGTNPHYFLYVSGYYAVDELYRPVHHERSQTHSVEKIQLNHYITKSLEDYGLKIARGRADAPNLPPRTLAGLEAIDRFCTREETGILRFVERTRRFYL